jgi:hypothetical protein
MRTRSNDTFEHVRGGGIILTLFGLPFLLAGIGVIIAGLSGTMKDADTGDPAPLLVIAIFGVVFGGVGALLTMGRMGVRVDPHQGEITRWAGLLLPFKSWSQPLGAYDRVRLNREIRRSDKSTRTVYPVYLSSGTAPEVKIAEPGNYGEARRLAEKLATCVQMNLHDESQGEPQERDWRYLDESLRDRAKRTGEYPEPPSQPADSKVGYRVEAPDAVFDLPGSKASLLSLIVVLPLLLWSAFVVGAVISLMRTNVIMGSIVMLIFLGLPWMMGLAMILKTVNLRQRVTVSPNRLELYQKSLIAGRRRSIPCDELEELNLTHSGGSRDQKFKILGAGYVVARSDRTELTFGEGLEDADQRWLRDVIHAIVVAKPVRA